MTEHFADRLAAAVRRLGNPVCVGLDPRWEQLPNVFRNSGDATYAAKAKAYRDFCCAVIDSVAPLVPVTKVQAAFFEALGPAGTSAMADVIAHAVARDLLVILDGKRNDIGSTAQAYAEGYLGRGTSPWGADAITVSPYLGDDSLKPFTDTAQRHGAGVFILVKTSNAGGRMLQDLECNGRPLYAHVAEYVEQVAAATAGDCGYGLAGAVVGATFPDQLARLRAAMPHTWFLVPGYGSQGGTAADVAAAFDAGALGAIVNNSRGILFAHESAEFASRFGSPRWQDAVVAATSQMIEELRSVIR
jgi:orotidine-5'-phosphate decarboxylase